MTVNEFVERNGITPTLARGRWKPWCKPGFFELTSTKDQIHVFPRIWDEVSGCAWVEDLEGRMRYVRVENLRKYKPVTILVSGLVEKEKKGKVSDEEKDEKKKQQARERLRAMGIDLEELLK